MKLLEILNIKKPKPRPAVTNRLMIEATAFFVLLSALILLATPVIAYEMIYKNKIYVGIYVDGINIGGLTKNQAIDELNRNYDGIRNNGLNFLYNNRNFNLPFTAVSPTDPDLAFETLNFSIEEMVDSAYKYGRQGRWEEHIQAQLIALLNKAELPLAYNLNEVELKNALIQKFSSLEKPAKDAQLAFTNNNEFQILPESDGFTIDYDQAISELKNNLNLIAINPIKLSTKSSFAQVRQSEAETLRPKVQEVLASGELTLKYEELNWKIKNDEFKNWIIFKKEGEQLVLVFALDLIKQKLEMIAQEMNVPPQDARFVMEEGKVTEFKPALPGLELDQEISINKINQEFLKDKNKEIELAVKESEPTIKTIDSNNIGIKELLGKGVSDFSGSHTNRIKNIKNAVAHLNGIIIPPGEFSTVDTIGEVNAATGYFPEYVIKGDRTILEYGGGLCQIGTTMFRAALYSGLPITERRPHSYIVSYYKPLGMDATIYGPHPDLRFNNDTGNNILLQIKIDGTILTFEFWGTSDGRKIEITDPAVYNRTGIPPDKLIENPDLKPGEKRKMETGRGGADTHFYRYIIKADGTKAEEIFRSHYVAWPNIYEVGITPETEEQPVADGTAVPSTSDSTSAGESGSNTNQNINSIQ